MLNASVNRSPLTRSVRVATVVALLSLTVCIAGLGARLSSRCPDRCFDATNRTLPDARLVLTNAASQAKHEVRSDRTGHFEFVGLPPGDYALEVSIPGFATFKDTITIIGRNIDRTIEIQVGSLEETITVTSIPIESADQLIRNRTAEQLQTAGSCARVPRQGSGRRWKSAPARLPVPWAARFSRRSG